MSPTESTYRRAHEIRAKRRDAGKPISLTQAIRLAEREPTPRLRRRFTHR